MLKSIKLFLINIVLFFCIIFFSSLNQAAANNIKINYEITWNNIVLGNVGWDYSLNSKNYEFMIELNSVGISSSLFPFYGKQFAYGDIENGKLKSKEYYHEWETKKKKRVLKILFENGKILSFESNPVERQNPKIDFKELDSLIDPISAFLQLIIFNNLITIDKVFDGRRIYSLSKINKKNLINMEISGFNNLTKYDLEITNYKNMWKDHDKKDLKNIEVIIGKTNENYFLPLHFKIKNKGLVFKINYLNHQN